MKTIPRLSPAYSRFPNGLSLCLYGGFPESEAQAMIVFLASCGLFTEDRKTSGITHALEHMLFKGTKKFSNVEITSRINSLGGSIDAYTTADSLCLEVQIASREIDSALEVLSDMVIRPTFPEEEIELEKKVILDEILYYEDDPEDFVTLSLEKLCFKGTCYAMPILGDVKSVSSFSRNDFAEYHKRCFAPNNCSLTVAGSFDEGATVRKIESFFGPASWTPGSFSVKNFDFMRMRPSPASASFRRKGKYSQDYVGFSFRLPARIDGRNASSFLLPYIFTVLRSAPLGFALREGGDAVNSVASDLIYKYGAWLFAVTAAVEPEKRAGVKKSVRNFISSLPDFVTAGHFEAAKNLLVLDYLNEIDNPRSYCSELSTFNYLLGPGAHHASVAAALALEYPDFMRFLKEQVAPSPLQAVELRSKAASSGAGSGLIVFPSPPPSAPEHRTGGGAGYRFESLAPRGAPSVGQADSAPGAPGVVSAVNPGLTHSTISVYLAGGVSASRIPGEAYVFAEMLGKGDCGRAAYEKYLRCDGLGVVMDCSAMMDYVQLEASCPGAWDRERLEFLAGVLGDFTFTSGLLERARKGVRRSAKNLMDDVFDYSFWSFARMMFASHPYSRFILGNESRLASIKRGSIENYYSRTLRAGGMVVSYSSPARVDDLVLSAFSGIYPRGKGGLPVPAPLHPPLSSARRRDREIRTPHTQCTFVAGGIAPAAMTADSLSFSVANHILTDYSGKRLWDLRESQGLCYNIFSEYIPLACSGLFLCYSNCDARKLDAVCDGVARQLERFCESGPTEREVRDARAQLLKRYEMTLASCAGAAKSAGHSLFYGRGVAEFLNFRERVGAVSRESVTRAAQKYLGAEKISRLRLVPR